MFNHYAWLSAIHLINPERKSYAGVYIPLKKSRTPCRNLL